MKKPNMNVIYFIIAILICIIGYLLLNSNSNSNVSKATINNDMVRTKYNSLISILGQPNYIESDASNHLKSATWMSPLDNFNDFGKYGGADYIKIHGVPSKKWHPYPANVFLIVGKYINVPEHLFGPIKYASETINIEQLFVPKKYSDKYYNSGKKEVALVTGSCASVTISAITVQFVMDMIEKYKKNTKKCLELYETFRNEYDRRIQDYLCGKGITDPIPWFDHTNFNEKASMFLEGKCNTVETFYVDHDELKKNN